MRPWLDEDSEVVSLLVQFEPCFQLVLESMVLCSILLQYHSQQVESQSWFGPTCARLIFYIVLMISELAKSTMTAEYFLHDFTGLLGSQPLL